MCERQKLLMKINTDTQYLCAQTKAVIDLYTAALIADKKTEAETHREQTLIIQGQIMDNIAAGIRLMKELGIKTF